MGLVGVGLIVMGFGFGCLLVGFWLLRCWVCLCCLGFGDLCCFGALYWFVGCLRAV